MNWYGLYFKVLCKLHLLNLVECMIDTISFLSLLRSQFSLIYVLFAYFSTLVKTSMTDCNSHFISCLNTLYFPNVPCDVYLSPTDRTRHFKLFSITHALFVALMLWSSKTVMTGFNSHNLRLEHVAGVDQVLLMIWEGITSAISHNMCSSSMC